MGIWRRGREKERERWGAIGSSAFRFDSFLYEFCAMVAAMGQLAEFQAVVMAVEAGAERMSVLTQKLLRVMLPIANRPLLFYHLFALERAGKGRTDAQEEAWRK